ncbi:MAG: PIN domain-containing protein [Candidatus Margulisbacteria bacterium]|jgi:predicted nucleic acid-binding protein|nr:PIN domain-containing protein [Candidatus Margulisiibacteriota bacterium]
MKIYLDICCYNRPFDDQSQMKIQLETIAKLHIQSAVRQNIYELVWSYMLDYENSNNPYEEKQNAIQVWKHIAEHYCKSSPSILQAGKNIEKLGIMSKDALHIACALHSKCNYFITTDLKLLKKKIDGIKLINPVDFVREVE